MATQDVKKVGGTGSSRKKLCDIVSHKHGQRLARGMSECMGRRVDGWHLFAGAEVRFEGVDCFPLIMCSRCGAAASYYVCNGEVL